MLSVYSRMEFLAFFFFTLMTKVLAEEYDFDTPRMRLIYPSTGRPKEYGQATIECSVTTTAGNMIELLMQRRGERNFLQNRDFPPNHRFTIERPNRCNTRDQQCVILKILRVLWIDKYPTYICRARHLSDPKEKKKIEVFFLDVSYEKFSSELQPANQGDSVYLFCPICTLFKSFVFEKVWSNFIDDPIHHRKYRYDNITGGKLVTVQRNIKRRDFGNYTCQSVFDKLGQRHIKTHVITLYDPGVKVPYIESYILYKKTRHTIFMCEVFQYENNRMKLDWLRDGDVVKPKHYNIVSYYKAQPLRGKAYSNLTVRTGTPGLFRCSLVIQGRRIYNYGYLSAKKKTESTYDVKIPTHEMGHLGRRDAYINFKCEIGKTYPDKGQDRTIRRGRIPTVTMKSISVEAGRYTSLRCKTSSRNNNIRVQWKKNLKKLTNTGFKISFAPVTEADHGIYTCIMSIGSERAKAQARASLTVYYKPRVTVYPANVPLYGKTSLSCYANARPHPTFEWFRGTIKLYKTKRILDFPRATLSDTGNYTCVASNKYGKGRASAKLTVVGGKFVSIPNYKAALEGSNVTLRCRISPDSSDQIIKWLVDDELIARNSYMQVTSSYPKYEAYKINFDAYRNNKYYDLTIHPLQAHHAGKYTCQYGTKNASADVIVHVPPRDTTIQITDQKPSYQEGDIANFKCRSKAYPYPTFTVHINSTLLTGSRVIASAIHPKNPGETSYSKIILVLNKMYHNRSIRCQASNKYGTSISDNSLRFRILFKPVIKPMDSKTISADSDIKLTCQSNANPPGIFGGWFKDNIRLPGHNTKVLIIKNAGANNSGLYKCRVNNSEGFSTSTTFIHVSGLSPKARLIPAVHNRSKAILVVVFIVSAVVIIFGLALALSARAYTVRPKERDQGNWITRCFGFGKKKKYDEVQIHQHPMDMNSMPCSGCATPNPYGNQAPQMLPVPYPYVQQPAAPEIELVLHGVELDSESTVTGNTGSSATDTISCSRKRRKNSRMKASESDFGTATNTSSRSRKKKKAKEHTFYI